MSFEVLVISEGSILNFAKLQIELLDENRDLVIPAEALEKLAKKVYNLIVLDAQDVPVGLDLINEIRKAGIETPIIVHEPDENRLCINFSVNWHFSLWCATTFYRKTETYLS